MSAKRKIRPVRELTDRDVYDICEAWKQGNYSAKELAAKYGMEVSTIFNIVTNRTRRKAPRPGTDPNQRGAPSRRILSVEDVQWALRLYNDGLFSMQDFADALGVSRGAARAILEGRTYKSVARPDGFVYPREAYRSFRPMSNRIRKKPAEILELAKTKYPLTDADLINGKITWAIKEMWGLKSDA